MKYIKWFNIFESNNNHLFDEAREIIEDYKSEVTDLGLDLVISPVDVGYIDENLTDVEYIMFKISTRDGYSEILIECYDFLYDLRSHLSRECDLDLKVYIHSDFPLFDLDDAVEVYGGEEWDVLEFYVYKKQL